MTSRALRQIWTGAPRRELLLFVLTAVVAVVTGFVAVRPAVAETLIVHGGYYAILALFFAFLFSAWRVASPRRAIWGEWLRRPGWVAAALICATVWAVGTDAFAHKVLFDEYVLQGTAWHMHATKEIGAPLRAYDIAGTWLTIDTFLDKRPYFFAFLLSLLHDLTGVRLENAFALNVALAFATLALIYWLVHTHARRAGPALMAVALFATMPLFGQNATGAGMELHNLAMIAVVMAASVLYLRAPDGNRLSLLVIATALLAQSRYESVLFVAPVAALVVLGWIRAERVLLPWTAILGPLLFVPAVWHERIVSTKPALWQLREGESSRFAWEHVAGNLDGAWRFFFATAPAQPNSLGLTLLGLGGLGWAVWRGWRWFRLPFAQRPRWPVLFVVVAWCSVAVVANAAVLMFYYWSRFDEPVTARFALPLCLLLALSAGCFVHALDRGRWPATRVAAMGLAIWVLVFAAPAYARRLYSTQNLVMHELDWELERVSAIRNKRNIFLITNKAIVPFLLERIPATTFAQARIRGPEIAWHLREGTFRDVLVSQVLRPLANGDRIVDPDDILPDGFRLEALDLKRFGTRWIQLSRVVEIALPPPASPAAPN